jgi:hypothetical protein
MSKIVNPYIKKAANKKWLEDNEETFLRYMAEHHSPMDLAHTYLHMNTLDDGFIESMIKKIEAQEKKLEHEAKLRKKKADGKPISKDKTATAVEKKMAIMEEAADRESEVDPESELLD